MSQNYIDDLIKKLFEGKGYKVKEEKPGFSLVMSKCSRPGCKSVIYIKKLDQLNKNGYIISRFCPNCKDRVFEKKKNKLE